MDKWVGTCTWDDVPHLSKEAKAKYWAEIPHHLRDARTKGIPQIGSGRIYPFAEEDVLVEPFKIPNYWPVCFGFDVGWNNTSAVWGAQDPKTETVYLYSEYTREKAEPEIHVRAILARGEWVPGVVDPGARGRSQSDGEQLIRKYRELGLDLAPADNAVETGLFAVEQMLSTGQLKIFNTLSNWLREFRIYRRNEKGEIIKQFDHLMDATRYLVKSGIARAISPYERDEDEELERESRRRASAGSTGRDAITGY